MPHDLPPGFHPWPGTRQPRDEGPFQVVWGNGFVDPRHYPRSHLNWRWDKPDEPPRGYDIIAVRKV